MERWAIAYRPKRFSEVLGQKHVVKFFSVVLERFYANQTSLPMGALFGGISGVGKTTLARVIAASLNCRQRDGIEPCGECATCVQIIRGEGGVIEIDASFFGLVDNIRQLRDQLSSYSFQDYQVVIIDECHMLSREASNVLLKLFEEPPENVLFILCTTEAEKILDTVRSRLVEFRFVPIAPDELVEYVQEILRQEGTKCKAELIRKLNFLSNSNVRDVLVALEQLSILGNKEISDELVAEVYGDVYIHDKILKALMSGEYDEAIDMYEKHAYFQADFRHMVDGIIIRLAEKLREAMQAGSSDAQWYAKSLRQVYQFISGKLLSLEGAAAARMLFFLLLPADLQRRTTVSRPLLTKEDAELHAEDVFRLLTEEEK